MTDDVKEAARRSPDGLPEEFEDHSTRVDCIADQAFSQTRVDSIFDEITSILNARTARLEGALAMIGARHG